MKEDREERTTISILADISDGKHLYKGTVVDISRNGLKIIDVPEKFDFYAKKYTAVITDKQRNFKLILNPRWSKIEKPYKEMGFKIVSPPLEWIKFVNELEGKEQPITPASY